MPLAVRFSLLVVLYQRNFEYTTPMLKTNMAASPTTSTSFVRLQYFACVAYTQSTGPRNIDSIGRRPPLITIAYITETANTPRKINSQPTFSRLRFHSAKLNTQPA